MAARKRASKSVELVYKLDGDLKQIDVFKLAPALLAVGRVIQESHNQLGAQHDVGVDVKPFGRGSFIVDIVLFVKGNWALLAPSAIAINEAMNKTTEILEAIGMVKSKTESVINVIKQLGGRVEKIEPLQGGDFRYSHGGTSVTVNGAVNTLMQNPIIHAEMVNLIYPPLQQEGVDSIDTYLKNKQDETEVKIEKRDAKAFEAFSGSVLPPSEPVKEIEVPAARYFLKLGRVSLEGKADHWSFRLGESHITAKVIDSVFLNRVRSGEYRLSGNDVIEADVVTTQIVSGATILSTSTEIANINYKPAPPNTQGNLSFPEPDED